VSSTITSVDDAFLVAQSLKPDEKLELISRLWESIRLSGTFRPSDADLEEIKRRWEEYESGKVKAIPWEAVRDEIRRKLASHE
jgi:putative addiction module component (TIGR02574 family)